MGESTLYPFLWMAFGVVVYKAGYNFLRALGQAVRMVRRHHAE
jgi:hypothetical protein